MVILTCTYSCWHEFSQNNVTPFSDHPRLTRRSTRPQSHDLVKNGEHIAKLLDADYVNFVFSFE